MDAGYARTASENRALKWIYERSKNFAADFLEFLIYPRSDVGTIVGDMCHDVSFLFSPLALPVQVLQPQKGK